MPVPNPIETPGASSGGVNEILFGFSGTISIDQNANILRYTARRTISLTRFWVSVVTVPTGGDVAVGFYVNGVLVATVTLLAGETEAFTDQNVTLLDGDVLYPQIDSMSTTIPPATMTMQAV